jgi:hypothetical protein
MPANRQKTKAPTEKQDSGLAGLELPLAAGQVAIQAWMNIGTEAVRFVWNRLQRDMETQQALLACKSLDDMRKVQAEFFTSAQQEYAAEAGKMLDLMGKASTAALAASAKARRYDDVPL